MPTLDDIFPSSQPVRQHPISSHRLRSFLSLYILFYMRLFRTRYVPVVYLICTSIGVRGLRPPGSVGPLPSSFEKQFPVLVKYRLQLPVLCGLAMSFGGVGKLLQGVQIHADCHRLGLR